MTYPIRIRTRLGVTLVAATVLLTGCSEPGSSTTDASLASGEQHAQDHDEHDHAAHQHGGWWCGEHGVPEDECAQCDKSLVPEFKAKGDWCEEHNRPDSQCFIDHPEHFEKYAALYEAKFGERPAMPTE